MSLCGICGTDIHDVSKGLRSWQCLGHEMVGVVDQTGPGTDGVEPGTPVAVRNAASCGKCPSCVAGEERFCQSVHACIGGFSSHVVASTRALLSLDGLPLEKAVLIEPLNVAIDLVKTAGVERGDAVVIVGPGPIGILAAFLCRLWYDSPLWVVGRSTSRRRLDLLERVSPRGYHDAGRGSWKSGARSEFAKTPGMHFLVTTSPRTIIDFVEPVAPFGSTFTTIGLASRRAEESVTIPVRSWMFRRLSLRTSFAYPNLHFQQARDLIARGDIPAEDFVSQTFPLARLKAALEFVSSRDPALVKAVVAC